jgi:hypothetical protein
VERPRHGPFERDRSGAVKDFDSSASTSLCTGVTDDPPDNVTITLNVAEHRIFCVCVIF